MSFLALAFGLGGLAIAFPILFHLIRPTPKGSQVFSSLMFLRDSPPRITKRSRVDNWLLLLLRAMVVLLLVAAFMRPFFRTGGAMFTSDLPGKRVAVLIDRSASMQRGDLWQKAQDELDEVLDDLEPGDDVALFTFDDRMQQVVGFTNDVSIDPKERARLIRQKLSLISPGWRKTDIGNALVAAADAVGEIDDKTKTEVGVQVVLISDMQKGADLSALQAYVWPEDVRVDVRSLQVTKRGNAFARVLPQQVNLPAEVTGRRVRVSNADDSGTENFQVAWADRSGKIDPATETNFYVPPGTNRVLRVPGSVEMEASQLILSGDESEFDNRFFATAQTRQQVSIACFGNEKANDPKTNLYFLSRVIPDSRSRQVTVQSCSPNERAVWENGIQPGLVVVTSAVDESVIVQLTEYVAAGGTVLVTANEPSVLGSLQSLLGDVEITEPSMNFREDYAMLARVDFSHPLFSPLSGPRFNDFTGIRFWKRLPVLIDDDNDSDSIHVIARFDDDRPAMWQNAIGKGVVIGMATSWRPDDSQLALSSKFVPLLTSLLAISDNRATVSATYLVGQTFPLSVTNSEWKITNPENEVTVLSTGTESADVFQVPGIYQFASDSEQFAVAVNMDASESQTEMAPVEGLESFDVMIGVQPTREEIAGSMRKMKDTQLENRQRIWKWLLIGTICFVILETLLASRQESEPKEIVTA